MDDPLSLFPGLTCQHMVVFTDDDADPSCRFSDKAVSRGQDEPCGDEGSTAKRFRPVHPDKSDVEAVVVRCGDVTVDNAVASDTAAANIICEGNISFETQFPHHLIASRIIETATYCNQKSHST